MGPSVERVGPSVERVGPTGPFPLATPALTPTPTITPTPTHKPTTTPTPTHAHAHTHTHTLGQLPHPHRAPHFVSLLRCTLSFSVYTLFLPTGVYTLFLPGVYTLVLRVHPLSPHWGVHTLSPWGVHSLSPWGGYSLSFSLGCTLTLFFPGGRTEQWGQNPTHKPLKPKTRNPETLDPKPWPLDPKPSTLDPNPPKPRPETRNPTSQTLDAGRAAQLAE